MFIKLFDEFSLIILNEKVKFDEQRFTHKTNRLDSFTYLYGTVYLFLFQIYS